MLYLSNRPNKNKISTKNKSFYVAAQNTFESASLENKAGKTHLATLIERVNCKFFKSVSQKNILNITVHHEDHQFSF